MVLMKKRQPIQLLLEVVIQFYLLMANRNSVEEEESVEVEVHAKKEAEELHPNPKRALPVNLGII